MKKVTVSFFVISFVALLLTPFQVGAIQDHLLTAEWIANNEAYYYQVRLEYDVIDDVEEGREEEHYAVFLYKEDVGIISLSINGEKILDEDDDPIHLFPHPKKGEMRDVSGWIAGMNDSGDNISSGYFWDEILEKGKPITFNLNLRQRMNIIKYNPPANLPDGKISITLKGEDNENWGVREYDSGWGGFAISLPVYVKSLDYQIAVGDDIIETGVVDFSEGGELQKLGSALDVKLPGGIIDVSLRYTSQSYTGLYLDGSTVIEDVSVPAKIFVLRKDLNARGINFYISNLPEAIIDVYVKDQNQKLTLANDLMIVKYLDENWGQFYISSRGYDSVVLVITDGDDLSKNSVIRGRQPSFNIEFSSTSFGEKG